MLTSLALVFLLGLAAAALCKPDRSLPRIIGMLLTGILIGPYVLELAGPIPYLSASRLSCGRWRLSSS